MQNHHRASALIIVIMVMMLLATMGIVFLKKGRLHYQATHNYSARVQAQFIAEAGINYSIVELRNYFGDKIFDTDLASRIWLFTADDIAEVEDDIGASVSLIDEDGHPSFYLGEDGKHVKYSGLCADHQRQTFSLKIFDTTAQLPLNTATELMLEYLSYAISTRSTYSLGGYGPLFDGSTSLAGAILDQRDQLGRFRSKRDLLLVAGMTTERLQAVWDYVTVHNSLQQAIETGSGEDADLVGIARGPVNINTASWPVLVAVFSDLHLDNDIGNETIEAIAATPTATSEAEKLATAICDYRINTGIIDSWDTFRQIVESVSFNSGDTNLKIAMVMANCLPCVHLRKHQPDSLCYQSVNKTDLAYSTTELCLFPLGVFEIVSWGRLLDRPCTTANYVTVGSYKSYAVAEIFHYLRHHSQEHFENGAKWSTFAERATANGFSGPNNLQRADFFDGIDPDWNTSPIANSILHLGYLAPVTYDNSVLAGGDLYTVGTTFQALFNGSLHGNIGLSGTSPVASHNLSLTGKNIDDLRPDGITFQLDNDEIMCFPADNDDWNLANDNISAEDGSLGIWFKLDQQMSERTLLFSSNCLETLGSASFNTLSGPEGEDLLLELTRTGNEYNVEIEIVGDLLTWYMDNLPDLWPTIEQDIEDLEAMIEEPLNTYHYEEGIQMQVTISYDPSAESLSIQAMRQYYKFPAATNATCPMNTYVCYSKQLQINSNNYPIRPHEWYHLGLRWTDYTDMDDDYSIVVNGLFRDEDGSILNRGLVSTLDRRVTEREVVTETIEIVDLAELTVLDPEDLTRILSSPNLETNWLVRLAPLGAYLLYAYLLSLDMQTIVPEEAGQSVRHLCLGASPVGSDSTALTIDDLVIANDSSLVDFLLAPSRYPYTGSAPIATFLHKFVNSQADAIQATCLYSHQRSHPDFNVTIAPLTSIPASIAPGAALDYRIQYNLATPGNQLFAAPVVEEVVLFYQNPGIVYRESSYLTN